MIDIHSHIIFDVDDGSKTLEQSIKYLKQIKKIGMNKVVCTPHMKHRNPEKLAKIIKNYKVLEEYAKKYDIELYLANEVMYKEDIIKHLDSKELLTINGGNYVLVEFKRTENMDKDHIYDAFERIIEAGYKPILAHPELYIHYKDIKFVKKLRNIGVIIQVDGTSLLKTAPINIYMYAHKLLKNYMIDIVASDSHCTKKRNFKSLRKAYKVVRRKDKKYADIIFNQNPEEVISNV